MNIFDIKHKSSDGKSRTGVLHLPHGDVQTPVFMPVGTNATVKAMNLQVLSCDMKKWGCQITGVNKSDESWMAVRKQVLFIRFYREPEPIDEAQIHESLDLMKSMNSVKAFLFSSSGFNTAAKRFAENRPIELIEKQKLEALLSKAGS